MIVISFALDDDVIISGDGSLAATTSGPATGPPTIKTSTPIVLVKPVEPY